MVTEIFNEHIKVAQETKKLAPQMEKAAQLLKTTLASGRKILVCGNGGSAADAQHFAAELVGKFKKERPAMPAIALTTDTSILTAVGNDYGFDKIFSRQVEALGAAGDVLIAISTSGNSPNVLLAMQGAQKKGMKIITLAGKGGGKMKGMADAELIVPSDNTPRIQEMHGLLIHMLCELID
ncbi:MAG: D-sedoheptulose 7-phosphate isomerase [Candidatus Micrarchaeota archaeon]